MNGCYDEGSLKTYLDGELSPEQHAAVVAHLAICPTCHERLNELRSLSERFNAVLVDPAQPPQPHRALQRWYSTVGSGLETGVHRAAAPNGATLWRKIMNTIRQIWTGRYRTLVAGATAVVLLLSLLAFPPVRAIADQLLQVFRVEKVMFVPVDSERMSQLEDLNFDGETLFVGEPTVINEPAEPRIVASAEEATDAVGYSVAQPTSFSESPDSVEISVQDRRTMQFQVNVEGARQLLSLLDITDVTLPDALGEQPITVDVPPSVAMRYQSENYDLVLFQGHSPDVSLPEGVDLSQPGYAVLRVLGMEPDQARSLSQEVDWSSTLIFPFPSDIGSIRQVTIGDSQGLLTYGGGERGRHGRHGEEDGTDDTDSPEERQLYWHSGGTFYVLRATGDIDNTELIAIAQSVQ